MLNIPLPVRIANAHAVLHGPHGDVTRRARVQGISRQALYRDTVRVLATLQGDHHDRQLQHLRAQIVALQTQRDQLQTQRDHAFVIDAACFQHFAATAQAEGVSLPVARRLLVALLTTPLDPQQAAHNRVPSVATLGRFSQNAAVQATALLAVLDEFSRPRVEQAAADEIFFHRRPCLMVIEQHSLCWVSGRLTERRDGATWAAEFRRLPHLKQTTQDGGTGLAKGLDLVNQERQQAGQDPLAAQDDHFHVLREGHRALRRMQARLTKLMDQAEAADRKAARKERRTGDGRGKGAAVRAWRRAEQALDAWSEAAKAWQEVAGALRLFTPEGALNTRSQAEAQMQAALPRLVGPAWAKVRRALVRPQLLTFLDQAATDLAALTKVAPPVAPPMLVLSAEAASPPAEAPRVAAELVAAAVRVEGLRRRPEALRGETEQARTLRGVLLAASLVLSLAGPAGSVALQAVQGVLRGVWRASSLVECLNSVARMQQGRHRRMTQGLLDLKRLYWNGRVFRTGPRRGQSPYELLGLALPTKDWWELLKLTPEQLRQQLQVAAAADPHPPPQQLSAQQVAA